MRVLSVVSVLALVLLAGCGSFDAGHPFGGGNSKTFDAPIARVKPAFVTTLSQMGMQITKLETRGRREIVSARKAGSHVDIEIERLGASSTRVRVEASGQASAGQILRQAEKNLGAG